MDFFDLLVMWNSFELDIANRKTAGAKNTWVAIFDVLGFAVAS